LANDQLSSIVPQVWNEIVGIVGDVKHERLDADPKPEVYFGLPQYPDRFMSLLYEPLLNGNRRADFSIRNQVLAVDASQPVFDIKTMDERVSKAVAPSGSSCCCSAFSRACFDLAASGIYGVICIRSRRGLTRLAFEWRLALKLEMFEAGGSAGMTLAFAVAVGLVEPSRSAVDVRAAVRRQLN